MEKPEKKRRSIAITAAAACAVLIIAGAVSFKRYYDNNYVVDDYYYTIVPLDYDFTPEISRDSNGRPRGYEKEYILTCYNADGNERELAFRAFLNFQELYPPETYVRVSVSKAATLRQNALAEAGVPETALARIKERFIPSSAHTLADYANERTRQLSARNTPSLKISCDMSENALIYTYLFSTGARGLAEAAAELQDHVYRAQFRTDKDKFPELTAIFLEIKLSDGTVVFSEKYNKRVEFGYEM